MRRWVVELVMWCWLHPRRVILLAFALCIAFGFYAAGHLGLDTDQNHLISSDLPFRKAERDMDRAFPADVDSLVAVIDAPTPEMAETAVERLRAALAPRTDLFRIVRRPVEETFFRRHGLLFLSVDELTEMSDRLTAAQPLLAALARDVSLRGLLSAVDLALEGAKAGQMDIHDLAPLLKRIDAAAAQVADGKTPPPQSWSALFGVAGDRDQPRRFLLTQPILDYDSLEAGRPAADAIRAEAARLGIDAAHGMRVRLTGSVALADANFATVAQGVEITTPLMILAVLGLLFLAVRSAPLVVAILVSLTAGLVTTAAFAAATVGTLNPISVAFAVMFVGIAVDFAIQFVIRFRDERFGEPDINQAMRHTTAAIAAPLAVAAAATAVGFLSFLPTQYTGVSQLGLIAGGGMVIALVTDFTLLPALLALLRPKAETAPVGLPLDHLDNWLVRHCRMVIAIALAGALAGAALLPRLPMDFNPLHLQNPKAEAVATFFELARDPDSGSYAIEVLARDPSAAARLAKRLDALAEVDHTMTLATFVPDDQDDKLAILGDLAGLLGPTLNPARTEPAPSADQLREAVLATAAKLAELPGTDEHKVAAHLKSAADAGPVALETLQRALIGGLGQQIGDLRRALSVERVSEDTLPPELVRAWRAPDGRMRVRALPKGDMQDEKTVARFVKAVHGVAPNATGMPISVEQSGRVVVRAFSQAGLAALAAIAVLLWVLLRRLLDAALVVLPLVVGALYTVIGCVAAGLAINFANIIALPLLLGIGVAFNIYFVINWRNGVVGHLASATTRAVLFSALTTGTAFGTLAVSPHLGTASMGLLLFLSLGLSVVTTFTFLPALFHVLGKPRHETADRHRG